MRRIIISILPVFIGSLLHAQSVGIGTTTPSNSAKLEISSTNTGLLIPRMTTASISAISLPAKGLLVLDTVQDQLMVNMGGPDAPNWQTIVAKSGWGLTGNNNTNFHQQFIGTTDLVPLRFRVNNFYSGEISPPDRGNVILGYNTGGFGTNLYASSSVIIGLRAMAQSFGGRNLVAIGDSALFRNNGGQANTAVGSKALSTNGGGNNNTALGFETLLSTSFRDGNTAIGSRVLRSSTTGSYNTGVGTAALLNNTEGFMNTALGSETLYQNVTGSQNVAVGSYALFASGSGSQNVAVGHSSQFWNEDGHYNTAVGFSALNRTTNSQYNTCIGFGAGRAFDMGYNNTILGANCDVNAAGLFNVVAIGQAVTITASSQARIGNAATNSIGGYAGWTNVSDGRFKRNITENVNGLEFIMKLKPVTYHLDITAISEQLNETRGREMDPQTKQAIEEKEKIRYSGFVAQEVEAAAREVGYDFSGIDKPKNEKDFYGLRYAEFVVPIVKAMQEQQLMIETMNKKIQLLEEQNRLLTQLLSNKK